MFTWIIIGIIMGIINFIIGIKFWGTTIYKDMLTSWGKLTIITLICWAGQMVIWAIVGPLGVFRNIHDLRVYMALKKSNKSTN